MRTAGILVLGVMIALPLRANAADKEPPDKTGLKVGEKRRLSSSRTRPGRSERWKSS